MEHERLNEGLPKDEIRIRSKVKFRIHPESRFPFEGYCYRFPDMVVEMNCFLKHALSRQRLLDVGAMHGIFSLVFSSLDSSKTAIAVDPSPLAFARLLYNVHRNHLSNIRPVECALSDKPGHLGMHFEWEHAVAAGTAGLGKAELNAEKRTGDDLCAAFGFEPDTVKIDVEGHEVKVLKGLRSVIEKHRPLIFLELHPNRIREEGDDLHQVVEHLLGLGYRVETVAGECSSMETLVSATVDQRVVFLPQ